MYLLVFVFLVVSMMGLYVETFSIQAARFFSSQTGVAQTFMVWHNAAYRTVIANWSAMKDLSPCQLTRGRPVGGACPFQVQTNTMPHESFYLPVGYNTDYTWSSYFYNDGTQRFVLTYMSPPAGGNAATPIRAVDAVNAATGFSVSEVFSQIENMKIPRISYGIVKGGLFVTRANIEDPTQGGKLVPFAFPLPSTITITEGSIGFISEL